MKISLFQVQLNFYGVWGFHILKVNIKGKEGALLGFWRLTHMDWILELCFMTFKIK